MQLRRAMEIVNSKDSNTNVNSKIFYKENQVNIISVDNNIGTAYVESMDGNYKYEVSLEQLNEVLY
ncbi:MULTISPECIES: small, acid-soluble spore protein, H family [unclassified Romboutsia]|uniref:small, acid-soluble spore protein, H family n=1 Tax=unclassified Romboutsia TaxID=2626894 RepID=UPI000822ED51|nr:MULTISPECIES: small, acid-soluble spore protein, H family [unclassified Romboutsia]SCH65278.1 small acid-soluble spore protein%2C H-type [uncultured Clostridium sp.]